MYPLKFAIGANDNIVVMLSASSKALVSAVVPTRAHVSPDVAVKYHNPLISAFLMTAMPKKAPSFASVAPSV
jgi:hypothetical protein